MHSQKKRRVIGSISALAAAAVLALGVAGAASAAPAPSTIDPTRTGTIVVHKFQQPATETGIPNNGKEHDATGLTPLSGVTFSVQQVDPGTFDLATNAGWNALKSLTVDAAASAAKGYTTSLTTGSDGSALAGNLPLGVYLLTETSYPAGVTPGAPFLITVPMTDPDHLDRWMYSVDVYPKNAVTRNDPVGDPTPTPGVPGSSANTGGTVQPAADNVMPWLCSGITLAGMLALAGAVAVRRRATHH